MIAAENSVEIKRPVQSVFEFLADGLNNPKWRDGVKSIALKSGDAGKVGAVYAQKLAGPGGRTIDGDYTIVEATSPSTIVFSVVAGPARPTGTFKLAPTKEGTSLTFSLALKPQGLMVLMSSMIRSTMNHEVASLATLKRVLEEDR